MRVVGADDIDRVLTVPGLVEALAEAFRGDMVTPVRHHHAIAGSSPDGHGGDATLLIMPAWTGAAARRPFVGVKIVSVYPDNASKGLPSILGTYLLMDGGTGAPLAALDGARLTLWRTTAASALASRLLSRPDARRLVMVGAGALSPFMIRAHVAVRPIEHVMIWNHRIDRARALAATLAAEPFSVAVADDLEAAVRHADIVSCATLSRAPIVAGAWLKPGSHLDLVGAFNLAMREADDDALRRASVFIDTPAAKTEGGDVALALTAGAIADSHVKGDLADLCRGVHRGRSSGEEITLFKSVGAASEDLAAAMLVWQELGAA
jgi:ornithine cyclodeaminase/alanine dehydrogenase-like protein (mu-crystallin family)